jgi:excisionase family DNA binding protein
VNSSQPRPSNPLLTPAEVAAAFRVDPKTVTRWAKAGKLSSIRTLGGHRRYLEADVLAIISGGTAGGSWPEASAQP